MNNKRIVSFLIRLLLILPAGVMADNLDLIGLDGSRHQLTDFIGKGKWTVVMIWSAHCGVCQYEAPKVEKFSRKYRDGQADVVGISVDGSEGAADARAFVREHGLSFTSFLADIEDLALLFYDATGTNLVGTPAFLVYNPQGDLRTYQIGGMDMAALETFIQKQSRVAVKEGDKS